MPFTSTFLRVRGIGVREGSIGVGGLLGACCTGFGECEGVTSCGEMGGANKFRALDVRGGNCGGAVAVAVAAAAAVAAAVAAAAAAGPELEASRGCEVGSPSAYFEAIILPIASF